MTKEPFVVHCGRCSHEWAVGFLPMPLDAFAKLAKSQCPVCGDRRGLLGPLPKPTKEGKAEAWIENGDTGSSSRTIWHVLMGRLGPNHPDVPHDPADFGRCYRLLKVMPSWRVRLHEVAAKYPPWEPLVDAWDELTALYEAELPTGAAPKLYARMKELAT